MGEKAVPSKENAENGLSDNSENDGDVEMADEDDPVEDMSSEEFHAINSQLDALNSALDNLEEKNDDIHAKLLELLESNREIRKQMQETNSGGAQS